MHFRFTDDHRQFAAALRELLEREFTAADLRRVWDDGVGHDPALWHRLADMGVPAMLLAESDGGLGGDLIDAILLIEELGRAGVPGPALETMTVGAVALAGTEWAKQIAAGELTVTAALMGEPLLPHRDATLALLAAGGRVIAAPTGELAATPVAGLDGGRLLAALPELEIAGTGLGTALDVDAGFLVDLGATSAAAYLLGLSSRMIDVAGVYARDRRQFGQPIGAFQAVKHLMANALLAVEFARPAVYRAAWSVATDQPTRHRDASMAKALASEAAQQSARAALQVHGAIGYTWECDLHLFMKKAWALSRAWGGSRHHRCVVAEALLGQRGDSTVQA